MTPDSLATILDYHRRTKHGFQAYAAGPGALDWDSQPAPFRHYAGEAAIPLPLYDGHPLEGHPAPAELGSLGALLHLAFGLTAWKSLGPDRWALRANPSSGNLHPLEAYCLVRSWPGLSDGVYHYRPDDHSLELRVALSLGSVISPQLAIALTTVPWREAWKYGERAFRYCQLDVGHGEGGLAAAAALLGWPLAPAPIETSALARLCGLDRLADFPGGKRSRPDTEGEEAEALYAFDISGNLPTFDSTPWLDALKEESARWSGPASTIDAHPFYRWPVINEVIAATRDENAWGKPSTRVEPAPGIYPPEVILGRRSAQRYTPEHILPRASFDRLLASTRPGDNACWGGFPGPARLHLLLFVHRVEGLSPGQYLFLRGNGGDALLALSPFVGEATPVPGIPGLHFLHAGDPATLHRLTRSLHCHQDMAANAALSLGMIAEFADPVSRQPAAYRQLYQEAGRLGQALYLEAEAQGVRGCGIGCFFDDPVHELLGLTDDSFQSLYHFTIGYPVTDSRIETHPPYAHLSTRNP